MSDLLAKALKTMNTAFDQLQSAINKLAEVTETARLRTQSHINELQALEALMEEDATERTESNLRAAAQLRAVLEAAAVDRNDLVTTLQHAQEDHDRRVESARVRFASADSSEIIEDARGIEMRDTEDSVREEIQVEETDTSSKVMSACSRVDFAVTVTDSGSTTLTDGNEEEAAKKLVEEADSEADEESEESVELEGNERVQDEAGSQEDKECQEGAEHEENEEPEEEGGSEGDDEPLEDELEEEQEEIEEFDVLLHTCLVRTIGKRKRELSVRNDDRVLKMLKNEQAEGNVLRKSMKKARRNGKTEADMEELKRQIEKIEDLDNDEASGLLTEARKLDETLGESMLVKTLQKIEEPDWMGLMESCAEAHGEAITSRIASEVQKSIAERQFTRQDVRMAAWFVATAAPETCDMFRGILTHLLNKQENLYALMEELMEENCTAAIDWLDTMGQEEEEESAKASSSESESEQ